MNILYKRGARGGARCRAAARAEKVAEFVTSSANPFIAASSRIRRRGDSARAHTP